jgi:hypothetical protein
LRPLIPRVRVGDVLKGTRNLRNYLQTASTLNYVNDLSQQMNGRKKSKEKLFRPSKNEKFLVTVNAWGIFGVCSLDSEVVLVFCNPMRPTVSPTARRKGFPIPMPGASGLVRMDPTIFSKWFIRTPMRKTDTRTWSDYEYHMWAALHLNLNNIRHDNAPTFHCQNGPTGPFCTRAQAYGMQPREHLNTLILQWIPKGITRATAETRRNMPSGGFGPRLEDIDAHREELQHLCSNPRIAQRLKAEVNYVYKAFMQNQ